MLLASARTTGTQQRVPLAPQFEFRLTVAKIGENFPVK